MAPCRHRSGRFMMAIDRRTRDTRVAMPRVRTHVLDVLTYWQLATPTGQTLTCELHRTTMGLYVRCSVDADQPLRSELASSLGAAYSIANAWKTSAVEHGFTHVSAR